jgi:hypothetical protein
MPTSDFEENRSFLLPARNQGIDASALKKFTDHYGEEFAKGYLMAFQDLLPQLDNIFDKTSHTKMQKLGFDLCNHMEAILQLKPNTASNNELNLNSNLDKPSPS